jgi:hypothetical protein
MSLRKLCPRFALTLAMLGVGAPALMAANHREAPITASTGSPTSPTGMHS